MPASLTFGPVTVGFDERVLRPRPWTLAQSEWAAELARGLSPGPILELCCGAGHIGQAAAVLSGRDLVQVDLSAAACEWATANAERAGLAGRVEVRCGSFEEVLGPDERFPLVVADPPYVPAGEVESFPDDPPLAIDGGPGGLDVVERCAAAGASALAAQGRLLIQVRGAAQAEGLAARLAVRRGEAVPPPAALCEVRTYGPDRALALFSPGPPAH